MVLIQINQKNARKLHTTGNLQIFVSTTINDTVTSLENLHQSLNIAVTNSSYNDPNLESVISDFDTNTVAFKQSVVQLTIDTSSTKSVSEVEAAITAFVGVLSDNTKTSAYDIVKKIPDYLNTDITNHGDDYKLLGTTEISTLITLSQFLQDFFKHGSATFTLFKNRMVVLTTNNADYPIIKTVSDVISALNTAHSDSSNLQTSLESIKTSLLNSIDTTTAQLDDVKAKLTTLVADMTTLQTKFTEVFHGNADNNSIDYVAP
jgi:hypothetical protein